LTNNSSAKNQTENFAQEFKSIIQGVWVRRDYINDLENMRSPYKSKKNLRGVASMTIQLSNQDRDSVHVGYGLNNHEGAEFTIYLKEGQKPKTLKTNLTNYFTEKASFFDLGYRIKDSDTSLVLYSYDKKWKFLDSTSYIRVAKKATDETDMGWGIQYITNKKLITGTYTFNDSTGNSSKIKFDVNGRVIGFLSFQTYYMATDFEAGPENNLDQIYFDFETKKQKMFTYQLNADTLNIYSTYENADSTELIQGKLKYKLVRQR
jgi:hypothetical protein